MLSNSWGGGSSSTAINNAINNAVNNGRGGKGCVVLFSTGNDIGGNGAPVSYPATLSNVIAVGATSMCDERKNLTSCDGENWWGSNFGNEIDIVAPGVKIYSTDISGSSGYRTGDYISDYNGTSSACPNAAGVAALILGVNNNFSTTKVREILEMSVDKIAGYSYNTQKANGSWNNEVGYGRVNAHKAVQKAIQESVNTSGSSLLCNNAQGTYSLNNVPAGTSIT